MESWMYLQVRQNVRTNLTDVRLTGGTCTVKLFFGDNLDSVPNSK